jgi:hypothetical protein
MAPPCSPSICMALVSPDGCMLVLGAGLSAFDYNRGFVDIPRKDIQGNCGSPKGYLWQFVDNLVVMSCDVVEF